MLPLSYQDMFSLLISLLLYINLCHTFFLLCLMCCANHTLAYEQYCVRNLKHYAIILLLFSILSKYTRHVNSNRHAIRHMATFNHYASTTAHDNHRVETLKTNS